VTRARAWRVGVGEASGAVADLGVLVPLLTALVLVNGLDPAAVLFGAGLLVLASGFVFRVPFPVQPLKALTAVAVARALPPEQIHAAGLLIGLVLLALSVRRVADVLARLFTVTVVRALQFGVGVLLVLAALRLLLAPPAVFAAVPPSPWPLVLAGLVAGAVAWSARRNAHGLAVVVIAAGFGVAAALSGDVALAPSPRLPSFALPPADAFWPAFVLLVVPQIPLTFGNAVVAVTDVARGYFGAAAARVTPSRVCRSAGVGNVAAALLGGMPMCHGSGGLTAHYRLGARTAGMNVLLGASLVVLGLVFAPQAPALLGLLPVWALAAFLAYAGARHALLVTDLSTRRRALAVAAGVLGAVLGNLAVTTVIVLAVDHGVAVSRRLAAQPA
jgi:SulP family sulfate permease